MFVKKVIENAVLLAILTQGWCIKPIREYAVDIGSNLTLPCLGYEPNAARADNTSQDAQSRDVMWIRDGRQKLNGISIQMDGSLMLFDVTGNDSGLYSCNTDLEGSVTEDGIVRQETSLKVRVKTPPPPLVNVTVHPSTILALVLWDVVGSGGYPIIDFTAEYRLYRSANGTYASEHELWKPITPNHIPPNSKQIDVYHLEPNTTYAFRVWATNYLGSSEKVEALGHTLHSDEEYELARHLLAGAENFDTRVWVVAVAVVMGTLLVLTAGTCFVLYRECKVPSDDDDVFNQEAMELVPNITLNPGFSEQKQNEFSTKVDNKYIPNHTVINNTHFHHNNNANNISGGNNNPNAIYNGYPVTSAAHKKTCFSFTNNKNKVKTLINNDKVSNGFVMSDEKRNAYNLKCDKKSRKV